MSSVLIDRLEKKELVKRRTTGDRRVRLVELTAKGRDLDAKTFETHAAAMEKGDCTLKRGAVDLATAP